MTNKATAIMTGMRPAKTRIPAQKLQTKTDNRTWMPQPCGISREDMRQIVLEMIG
jgi:hypothetical protein